MSEALSSISGVSALQHKASNPAASAWVSANAGSGKTYVLTQRVVRLLLKGVAPARILCLTFTKAAAANMSIRVFKTLADWTRLDDEALRRAILNAGADAPDASDLLQARRLFAKTVETPGGLKIQTIHAFCERLLHLFPFEANVAAGFEVIDDRRKTDFMAQARRDTLESAASAPHSLLADSVRILARETGASGFDELLNEALHHRHLILQSLQGNATSARYRQALAARLGLDPDLTQDDLTRDVLDCGIPRSRWPDLVAMLQTGSKADQNLGDAIRAAISATEDHQRVANYRAVFLTKTGTIKKSLVTAPLQKKFPDLLQELETEATRVLASKQRDATFRLLNRSTALLDVTNAIFSVYERAKRHRGLLDFDDLIERTAHLLERADAAWVLYKLDAGIDHILVDEAQDTSPQQWNILQALTTDFLSGAGARSANRTFFAVGDDKQSIYSFQGAAPHQFNEMKGRFKKRHDDAGIAFEEVGLKVSFRSSAAVLDQIDKVFAIEANRKGLSSDTAPTVHEAWKAKLPGLVEIWPLQGLADITTPEDWRLPLDLLQKQDPPVIVAKRIAQVIAGFLSPTSPDVVHDGNTPRRIHGGDILILVRTRGPFFEAINRALKEAGVPVAGADRLKLAQHIAVQDLTALGQTCLLPNDDLTLACVLKSPLIGLDDDDLLQLAPQRTASLRVALDASDTPAHRLAAQRLATWQKLAGTLSPFQFYARVLGADHGRRDLVARLGPEASDAMDEFLNEALAYESEDIPNLTGFLSRFAASGLQIKRDMDAASDAVRVMTVHAAKGLEAKIVFLPDTCGAPSGRHDPKLFLLEDSFSQPLLAWSAAKDSDPQVLTDLREDARDKQAQEYRRLLYVAMTRAEERLYIAGFHGAQKPLEGAWYSMVRTALEPHMTDAPLPDGTSVLRFTSHPWPPAASVPAAHLIPATTAALAPAWLWQTAPLEQPAAPPISPSNALARADQRDKPTDGSRSAARDAAALTGRLVHALLQYLPDVAADSRALAAQRFLQLRASGLSAADHETILQQVTSVLEDPLLAGLFGKGSRSEVAIAGRVDRAGGTSIEIAGQIDRLVDTGTDILFADFKTGAARPHRQIPKSYVTQMALYQAALAPLWPDRPIRAFLIWTSGPSVIELSANELRAALSAL